MDFHKSRAKIDNFSFFACYIRAVGSLSKNNPRISIKFTFRTSERYGKIIDIHFNARARAHLDAHRKISVRVKSRRKTPDLAQTRDFGRSERLQKRASRRAKRKPRLSRRGKSMI